MTQSYKILLVDDNPLALKMMDRALTKEGFTCFKATSAAIAMEQLRKETPDIILSDYEMPHTNGFEFRQHLINEPEYKNIPFMFLTSESNTDLMIEGMHMDAIDYIIKDVPLPVIVSKISNILDTIRDEHQRSISELSKAAVALHLNSIPQKTPQIAGYDINFWHKPFQDYPGGDFIDFIVIDERFTVIVLGDVMGKKWGAWFFSFGFLSYVRAAVRLCVFDGNLSTKSIMQKINRVVYEDPVVSEVLSTLSLLMLDTEQATVSYTGAGDLPLLYYDKQHNETRRIISEGLLLGLREDGDFDENIIKLNPGDQLMLITDGMTDMEQDGRKRSDYLLFENAVTPYLGTTDSFIRFKESPFIQEKTAAHIDDCSLIFLQKQA